MSCQDCKLPIEVAQYCSCNSANNATEKAALFSEALARLRESQGWRYQAIDGTWHASEREAWLHDRATNHRTE